VQKNREAFEILVRAIRGEVLQRTRHGITVLLLGTKKERILLNLQVNPIIITFLCCGVFVRTIKLHVQCWQRTLCGLWINLQNVRKKDFFPFVSQFVKHNIPSIFSYYSSVFIHSEEYNKPKNAGRDKLTRLIFLMKWN
jgi:hypothetical protein